MALARVEVGAALHTVAKRLSNLQLQDTFADIPWSRSHADTDAGPTAVPVTW